MSYILELVLGFLGAGLRSEVLSEDNNRQRALLDITLILFNIYISMSICFKLTGIMDLQSSLNKDINS